MYILAKIFSIVLFSFVRYVFKTLKRKFRIFFFNQTFI